MNLAGKDASIVAKFKKLVCHQILVRQWTHPNSATTGHHKLYIWGSLRPQFIPADLKLLSARLTTSDDQAISFCATTGGCAVSLSVLGDQFPISLLFVLNFQSLLDQCMEKLRIFIYKSKLPHFQGGTPGINPCYSLVASNGKHLGPSQHFQSPNQSPSSCLYLSEKPT